MIRRLLWAGHVMCLYCFAPTKIVCACPPLRQTSYCNLPFSIFPWYLCCETYDCVLGRPTDFYMVRRDKMHHTLRVHGFVQGVLTRDARGHG